MPTLGHVTACKRGAQARVCCGGPKLVSERARARACVRGQRVQDAGAGRAGADQRARAYATSSKRQLRGGRGGEGGRERRRDGVRERDPVKDAEVLVHRLAEERDRHHRRCALKFD